MANCCLQGAYYGNCEHKMSQYRDAQKAAMQSVLYGLSPVIKKEKEMSVVDKIKRLTMDKDDRLLVDYKLVDECGDLTCEGKDVVWSLLLKTHKAELVAKVRELDDEEKSKKKGKK